MERGDGGGPREVPQLFGHIPGEAGRVKRCHGTRVSSGFAQEAIASTVLPLNGGEKRRTGGGHVVILEQAQLRLEDVRGQLDKRKVVELLALGGGGDGRRAGAVRGGAAHDEAPYRQ